MAKFELICDEGDTRKDVYEELGTFILKFVLEETRAAYENGFNAGMKEGYRDGHRDGMTEAVTTITE